MINYSHSIAFDILNDTGGATAQLTNLCSKNVFHSVLVERLLKYPCAKKHILTFLGPEHRWCKDPFGIAYRAGYTVCWKRQY